MRILRPARLEQTSLAAYALNGPSPERTHGSSPAGLLALGGPAAVLHAAADADDEWNPALDERTGGFDVHLGVYTRD